MEKKTIKVLVEIIMQLENKILVEEWYRLLFWRKNFRCPIKILSKFFVNYYLNQVSFFDSQEKCEVILRNYNYEEAFLTELKVRETYNISTRYFEQILNYHRDETYTHLTISEAEKMSSITFERYDC